MSAAASTAVDPLAAFEAGDVDPAFFSHRDHIRVAWELVRRRPLEEAIESMAGGLRRLTARAGKPERYHETLTWIWMLLVADRACRREEPEDFGAFLAANPELLDASLPRRLYRRGTLESPLARRRFLLPDRLAASERRRAPLE